jgi:hypothetical protein
MAADKHDRRRSRAGALLLRSVGVWLMLAALATLGGVARELWLVPRLGDLRGHQVGTVLVTAAFLVAIALFVRRTRLTPREGLLVGLGWLAGAVAFEFGFGHYVDGLPWSRLVADYDLSQGRLLLLLWLAIGAGPFLLAALQQRRSRLRTPTSPRRAARRSAGAAS